MLHSTTSRGWTISISTGGGRYSLPPVSHCLNAGGMGRIDYESETFIPTTGGVFDVAHSLRGEGFDASEDGTGRGTPLTVAYGLSTQQEPKWAEGVSPTLARPSISGGGQVTAVAFQNRFRGDDGRGYDRPPPVVHGVTGSLETVKQWHVAFDCKGSQVQTDTAGLAPTLRSMSHDASHQNGGGHLAGAFDLRGREGGAMPEGSHDTANIRAASGGSSRSYVLQQTQQEMGDADAYEADASSVLSTLRRAVGKKAFRQWGLGVLAALRAEEVLQSWLHGASLRGPTEETRPKLDDSALPREESSAGKLLRQVWENGPDGRTSQGRGLAKQLAGKPSAPLSVLPHEDPQPESDMLLVHRAREGARVLREALSAVQEVGRSAGGEGQPEHAPWAVRRLTPTECEKLMGFPDGYTDVPVGNRRSADGPRYKMLGNSWAVNVVDWIAERITEVDAWP